MNVQEVAQQQTLAELQHRLATWRRIYAWALVVSGTVAAISTVCLILLIG